jgi:hypothetical protein
MKKYLFIILLFSISLHSCDNFLEEVPYNKITAGNFYTTPEGIKLGVNGLYSELKNLYGNHFYVYTCEAPTDIFKAAIGMDVEFRTWTLDATSGNVNSLWTVCYRTINQANSVIDALENYEIQKLNESLRNQYIGEAKFIRANMYYHLVQQFGDVPLKTLPTTTVETESVRVPSEDVWNLVIDDLKFGEENLPESYPAADFGRVTKYAAMHHLARVYLTVKRNDTDIQSAKTLTESILNSGKYQLVSNHKTLWSMANQINSEVIFPVLFVKNTELNGAGNQLHVMFTASYSDFYQAAIERDLTYGRPFSRIRPTWFLENLYNEDIDQRWEDCFRSDWLVNRTTATDNVFSPITKQVEQITWNKGDLVYKMPKNLWTKEQIAEAWPTWVWLPDTMRAYIPESAIQSATNPNAEWPINTKFQQGTMYHTLIKNQDPERPSVNALEGSRDIFIFRLADTYLLAAEACHLLGDNAKAAQYINVVRTRAAKSGMEDEMQIASSDININFILDERARELCGEMHRWYDLKRTGKLLERMTNPKMNEIVSGLFKDYHVLRPIPRNQLTRITNPADFPQNPGYGN